MLEQSAVQDRIQDNEQRRLTAVEFNDVYNTYKGYVYGVLRNIVGRDEVVTDLTNDVFLKVARATYWKGPVNWPGWLAQTARNTAIDHIRHERASRRYIDNAPIDGTPVDEFEDDNYIPINDDVEQREEIAAVMKAMKGLPLLQSNALQLYADGYTFSEIATLLHCKLPTAKSRVYLACAKLREELTQFI